MKKSVLFGAAVCICFMSNAYAQDVDYDNFETLNILSNGKIIASGYFNTPHYIYEGDFATTFSTYNGKIQDPAYVGVLQNRRMTINELRFTGGTTYEDGGWFDSSAGMPMVQIMVNPGDAWTDVKPLEGYPVLNGTDMAAAADTTNGHARSFPNMLFDPPLNCVGIRVAGKGATGNNPSQSNISCAELRAFGTLGAAVNTYEIPFMDGALPTGSNYWHPRQTFTAFGDVIIDGNIETYAMFQEVDIPGDILDPFFGFYAAHPITLNSVSFQHGKLGDVGGWFNTDGGSAMPKVWIRRTAGAEWEEVGTIDNYPVTTLDTFRADLPADIETRVFTYTFSAPTTAIGVRISGFGSFNIDEVPFAQCAEIWYEGSGSHAYSGPAGTGRASDGKAFQPDANGEIFIESNWGRSINNAYRVFGHGAAENGLVIRANFGPKFIEDARRPDFANMIVEYDFEIPAAGDYSVFIAHDILTTWTDSLFITMDDQDELTIDSPDIRSGTIRFNPTAGTPGSVPDNFNRELISVTGGWNFWTLAAGEHTLRLAYREPAQIWDWFLITQDFAKDINAYEPPDVAPPASVLDYPLY